MPSERARVTDWEHLLFIAFMLAFVVWYLGDAAVASPTFSNLILIAPVGAVAAMLLLYVGSTEIFGRRSVANAAADRVETADEAAAPGRFRAGSLKTVALLMCLFGLFVAAMPYAGFDVASFVFVVATLWLLGERGVMFSLLLALGISAAISVAALTLLSFPIPMGIARAVWSAL